MKKLFFATALLAVGGLSYASDLAANRMPKTVQGIDYASTLKKAAIKPMSDYPSDPGDLAVPEGNFTFDMIQFWAGEGENRAALVVQFNDDREKNALVFGYRWNGQATGSDMIKAVAKAHPHLYTLMQYTNVSSPTDPNGGYTINGFGWDFDDDGDIRLIDTGHGNQEYTSEDGFFEHPRGYKPGQGGSSDYDYDNWKAGDTDDFWGAGWYQSYWSYWVKEGEAASFGYSSLGASGRVLQNNSWDGWNFSIDMMPSNWKNFAAAPAPIPDDAKTLFKNNGIYYQLKSYTSKTVTVIAPVEIEGEEHTAYHGNINIPEKFTDEGIEYTVVGIADKAFYQMDTDAADEGENPSRITLPKTVTEIGASAFESAYIDGVDFAEGGSFDQIKKLGESAFKWTCLTAPLFSKQISKLPVSAFEGISAGEIILPDYITEVGNYCFRNNEGTDVKIVIPASVKKIGNTAFSMNSVASVKVLGTVPPEATNYTFSTRTYNNATLFTPLGYKETYLAANGFRNFKKCEEFAIEVHTGDIFDMNGATYRVEKLGDINEVTLTFKRNADGTVDRNSISAANAAAYTGTLSIAPTVSYQNVTFTVTAMTDSTFYGATELTAVTLPEGIKVIPAHSFYGCPTLASVGIPAAVTKIGRYAFADCKVLDGITLPETLTEIGERAFSSASALTAVALPASLKSIGATAFYGCSALTAIEIPAGVETFGSRIFCDCKNLKLVKLPQTLTALPQEIFYGCTGLTAVDIPASVTELKQGAFNGCTGIASITLPEALTTIGNSVFNNCKALSEVKFGSKVTKIGSSAFAGCTALVEAALPESVTELNSSLFSKCSALKKVTISRNVKMTASYVFQNCSSLETIAFYDDDTTPGAGVIRIPDGTTSIGSSCFEGCTRITDVIFPEGFTSIGSRALASTGIISLVLPSTMGSMSYNTYICQKCNDATVYATCTTPFSIGSSTFSVSGYSGPFMPVVVFTGLEETFKANSNWAKSEISAPAISEIKATVDEVTAADNRHIVSGHIELAYDKNGMPARFEAANTAYIFNTSEITFEIETPSRAVATGTVTAGKDGAFTAEIEGLTAGTDYEMNLSATHSGNSYAASASFKTPGTSGIGSIEVNDTTVGDIFSISGVRVATAVTVAEARETLPTGIYVLRSDGSSHKIVIR